MSAFIREVAKLADSTTGVEGSLGVSKRQLPWLLRCFQQHLRGTPRSLTHPPFCYLFAFAPVSRYRGCSRRGIFLGKCRHVSCGVF